MGLWFMVCGLRKKSNHKLCGFVSRLFWKPQTTNHKLYGFVLSPFWKPQTTNHKPYGFMLDFFWKPQTTNLMGLNAHISSALRA